MRCFFFPLGKSCSRSFKRSFVCLREENNTTAVNRVTVTKLISSNHGQKYSGVCVEANTKIVNALNSRNTSLSVRVRIRADSIFDDYYSKQIVMARENPETNIETYRGVVCTGNFSGGKVLLVNINSKKNVRCTYVSFSCFDF